MKPLLTCVAVVAMAAALAGCNRGPGTNTAYNNSGASAAPGSTPVTTSTSSPTTDNSSPGASMATAAAPSASTSAGNGVSDTVMTGKLRAAIASEPGLKDSDIIVRTDGGVVVLTGSAKSQDQVAMATSLAQRQEGVSRVDNRVTVK